jgi:RNA polymerase sigma-70 factor (ECF subfamily)
MAMSGDGSAAQDPAATDEALMRALVAGHEDALQTLYTRYAPLVFALCLRSLDRPAAEEVVQDVFLSAWRNAEHFDPARGPLRPWLLRIAQNRVLNELRSRSRRPAVAAAPEGDGLDELADREPDPSASVWLAYRRAAVRAAMDELPPAQRQALGLAFFEDLTHEQVAELLELRLGTAKTRIRSGLTRLRAYLAPLVAVLAAVSLGGAALVALHHRAVTADLVREQEALDLVTSSDVVPIRADAVSGLPADAHATYRARAGAPVGVLTLSHFPAAPPGRVYQAWVRRDGVWRSLGQPAPDAGGRALLIVDEPSPAGPIDALELTLEPIGGSATPIGPVVAVWPKP